MWSLHTSSLSTSTSVAVQKPETDTPEQIAISGRPSQRSSLSSTRQPLVIHKAAACHPQGSSLSSTRQQRPSHHKRKVLLPGAQLNIKEQLVIKGAARHQDSSLSTRDTADNKHTCSRTSNSTSQKLKCPITETSSQGHKHCLLWLSHKLQCQTS